MQRGFGTAVSARAFGHDGAAGQVAFADPGFGLSVCFLTSALDADLMRQIRRSIAVADKAVACVAGAEQDPP
jgi:CubicO group peptidase (beta-lactamase class C family)